MATPKPATRTQYGAEAGGGDLFFITVLHLPAPLQRKHQRTRPPGVQILPGCVELRLLFSVREPPLLLIVSYRHLTHGLRDSGCAACPFVRVLAPLHRCPRAWSGRTRRHDVNVDRELLVLRLLLLLGPRAVRRVRFRSILVFLLQPTCSVAASNGKVLPLHEQFVRCCNLLLDPWFQRVPAILHTSMHTFIHAHRHTCMHAYKLEYEFKCLCRNLILSDCQPNCRRYSAGQY